MSGLPVAVDQLTALVGCDAIWSRTCRGLVSLLRRYSTGLTLSMAADELIADFRAEERALPDPTVWTGEVLAAIASPTPAWLVKMIDTPYERRFVAYVHSSMTGLGVKRGHRLRIKPQVLRSDPSHQSPVHLTQFAADAERPENYGPRASATALVPTRHIVFEIAVPSGEGDTCTLPERALELLTTNSLLEIWNSRNTTPQWVSGEVVQITAHSIHIQDIGSASSSRPVVEIQLDRNDAVFTQLVGINEQLLLRFPAVRPCGNSFTLSLTQQTIIFALPHRSLNLPQYTSTQQETSSPDDGTKLSVLAPPAKRRRTPGVPSAEDLQLADLSCRITAAHINSLTDPASQPPFDILAIVISLSIVSPWNLDDKASCSTYVRANFEGQLVVDLPTVDPPFSPPRNLLAIGHVLWIEQLHWVQLGINRQVDSKLVH
jgi:hypothetical protein